MKYHCRWKPWFLKKRERDYHIKQITFQLAKYTATHERSFWYASVPPDTLAALGQRGFSIGSESDTTKLEATTQQEMQCVASGHTIPNHSRAALWGSPHLTTHTHTHTQDSNLSGGPRKSRKPQSKILFQMEEQLPHKLVTASRWWLKKGKNQTPPSLFSPTKLRNTHTHTWHFPGSVKAVNKDHNISSPSISLPLNKHTQ